MDRTVRTISSQRFVDETIVAEKQAAGDYIVHVSPVFTTGGPMRLAMVPQLPNAWILLDDDGAWIVDNVPGGLRRRRPYRGNQTPKPIPDAEARLMLQVLGETMVGVADIAGRLSVKADTVQAWRHRHANFPAPIATLATGPVWAWSDVERWAAIPRRCGRPRKEG